YALGVLLYELLTGELPHRREGTTLAALSQEIARETVERPSRVVQRAVGRGTWRRTARRLDGDLDLIVLRALRREPARRYPSAAALAADLRLWLKGRPVQARPDSMAYRVRKFAGRHVLGIVASVLIALSLVAGLTATLVQAARARREAALARAEAQRAERIKDFTLSLLYEASPVHAAKGR